MTGFRSYLPDALRLRFDEQLSVRAIAQQLGLSHSTIHNLFQRFNASGIVWPLPESLSVAQLDAILSTTDEKWLFRNLGGDFHASGLITLCLSSSNPARPY
ncbi:TPA: helix-turn-helix domain-containing protein, partial [Shigella boydii]